ncbi:3'(2'),5'-bisphosphate nucleotidase [Hydrogenovibrio sp. SC-1]|uniref:3'(2'),5'-bisphosphate nucleotidase CysQ n=1 Tax=Hydrogenovibrio sp. SC-1 TaxID=2065820 RepID=UPI000C7CE419|nr:3'(2'),5'-bisphosphate nucleotidase CysQ [Hydrogenovibrio sp. SC-1]PLA75529.1 3'(2'),5'-bisphosphate nucleotidase [Hydrogenovibrio sp. SC-1]
MSSIPLLLDQIDITDIISIAKEAGEVIMTVYVQDFQVAFKADESPLTEADQKSNQVIEAGLKKISDTLGVNIPILSEEGRDIPYEERKSWTTFWLVDPLDGTKEFVKRNDEFTVNIALIHNNTPVLGVVYTPALGQLYYAKQGDGAFKSERINSNIVTHTLPIASERKPGELKIVASKSHLSKETEQFIDDLAKQGHKITLESIGSSLKLCLVAEGKADIYPRLGPTMEWDTGAAHAIVNEAGFSLQKFTFEHGYEPHLYNKENLLNDWFVVK